VRMGNWHLCHGKIRADLESGDFVKMLSAPEIMPGLVFLPLTSFCLKS